METPHNFGSVSGPIWDEVYVVGGGPSCREFDFDRLRGRTVIAVNDVVWRLPWSAAVFSLDRPWIQRNLPKLHQFAGEKYLAISEDRVDLTAEAPQGTTFLLRQRSIRGLSCDPRIVHLGGGNSGFGAFNLAFLKGARRIVLLGLDYTQVDEYWYGGDCRRGRSSQMYADWAREYAWTTCQLRQRGVRVWNASPISLIKVFPHVGLGALPLEREDVPAAVSTQAETALKAR